MAATREEVAVLDEQQWRARQARHEARVAPFVAAHRERRLRGEKHPVWDFLFEYYSFKPTHLMRWSPGVQVLVRGGGRDFEACKEFSIEGDDAILRAQDYPLRRCEMLCSTLEILRSTASRAPQHGCLGLHEWAMVYRTPEVRHGQTALRLSADEIAALVDSQGVRCSHYDAFRFFAPDARGLNLLQPTFETRAEMEQPGCIHANMDLYKWSYKFFPWITSDLIADAFEVAVFARELDMRASPYDLRSWGFEPIRIETGDGRREYQAAQQEVARRAQPVRQELISALESLQVLACSPERPSST
jgi:hypothetical protein